MVATSSSVPQVTDELKKASDMGIRRTRKAQEPSSNGSRKLAKYFHKEEQTQEGEHHQSPTIVSLELQGTAAATTIAPIETCSHSPCSSTTVPNAMMLPEKDPHVHTMALNSDPFQVARLTGQQLHAAGCIDEALLYFGYALRLKRKTLLAEDHSVQAAFSDILFDIGVIQAQQGGNLVVESDDYHYLKSMDAFRICLDVRQHCFGSDHPAVASVMYHLALSYAALDEKQTAIELLMESLAILQFYTDENQVQQGVSQQDLSRVWMTLGKVQESLGLHEEAKSSFQEALEAESDSSDHSPDKQSSLI
jgi:Tetratricopeptide repeat